MARASGARRNASSAGAPAAAASSRSRNWRRVAREAQRP
jgi:hypothetical protein